MDILLLTNMGRTDASPASGEFVRRQLSALEAISENDFTLSYYEMPAKAMNAKSPLVRYSRFLFTFFKQHIFLRKKYAVLHVHFFFPTILLAIAYKIFRNSNVRIVTTFHGNDVYYYKKFSWWYRWCFSFVDHSIFVTEKLKHHFFQQDMSHSTLCAGMLPIFSSNRELEHTVKKYDFIFVGTLDKNKGVHRLIKLITAMPNSSSFVIVGAGAHENDISELAETKDIDYFHFRSAEQLVNLYHQSKWLVNLSYNESFGLVITEALACGLPVLATKTDGASSQVTNNENGFLVAQGEELISHFVALLTNTSEEAYTTLSKNAQQGGEKFTLPYVAKEIKDIYLKVGN